MNIEINDNEFKPDLSEGVPTPNSRQAHKLDEMINRLMADVVKDLDSDPDDYLPRFEAFASTLKGARAFKSLADADRALAIIKVSRKRARTYVEQISDMEIANAFGDGLPVSYERKKLLEAAMGIRDARRYYIGSSRHNVLLENAWEYGKALPAQRFINQKEEVVLPNPLPEKLVERYNQMPGINQRKRAIKDARANFSNAYWKAKNNIIVADQLFAERFRLMWVLVDAENEHERLASKLTKPLEEYVSYWEGWRDAGHFEYKHKGAEATRQAQKRIDRLNEQRVELEEKVNNPGWSISTLVREAWDSCEIFQLIYADEVAKTVVKNEKDKQKLVNQQKKLLAKQKLAETPIEVDAVVNEDGLWMDHRALIEGLKGRTNVTQAFGRSYLKIRGVVVETTKFKRWLGMALQDPNTNRRIPKHQWDQIQWAHVGVGTGEKAPDYSNHKETVPSVYFITQTGSMRVTTNFYDQSDDFAGYHSHNRDPVLNIVQPVEVEASIPEHRDVWTPGDIKKYRPSLVPARGSK